MAVVARMPDRPWRVCGPGCTVLVRETSRCPKHAARFEAAKAEARKAADARRPSSSIRGYSADWVRCRRLFLAEHPLCCVEGCGLPAVEVDHIVSVRAAPELRLRWSNLRGMCRHHHSARTGRDQGAFSKNEQMRSLALKGNPTESPSAHVVLVPAPFIRAKCTVREHPSGPAIINGHPAFTCGVLGPTHRHRGHWRGPTDDLPAPTASRRHLRP